MIPQRYRQMWETHPDVMRCYEAFGQAVREAGPLTAREVSLVKLAISIGAGLEGAAHSHARKAIEAGCSKAELTHVALLAAPTIGFPAMMRGRAWVEDVIDNPQGPDDRRGPQQQLSQEP